MGRRKGAVSHLMMALLGLPAVLKGTPVLATPDLNDLVVRNAFGNFNNRVKGGGGGGGDSDYIH